MMNKDEVEEFASKIAEGYSSPENLAEQFTLLKKLALEKILDAEMDEHLGYEKNSPKGRNKKNSRNGYSTKTIRTEDGHLEIDTPRDRESTFEPKLIPKNKRSVTGLDDKIITLYAKGQTTRDIAETLKDLYDVEVSHTFISKVTESIMEDVHEWQNRPLDNIYPIVYLDCIVVKVHQDKRVINKAVYLALGVNSEGHKELLGIWISENEGAKFWLSVLTELQNRGVKDILIACVDGLSGFPEAINAAFPKTKIQLCIVHMIRSSLKYVSYKDRKEVVSDLKKIYGSITENEARNELEQFGQKWNKQYESIYRSWDKNWENLITLFDYPDEIRKIIYTTNAIESLNSVIRKAIKNRRIFPNDNSAFKVIYLAIVNASKKWSMPLRNWKPAMNRFLIEYEDRL